MDKRVEEMQEKRQQKVTERVHASMKEFPYCYTTKTITGYDEGNKKRRRMLTEKEMLLLRRRQQAVKEEHRLSEFIESISDSKIRRIVSLRYEEGYSWAKVAKLMNCDRTYPEKLLTKYLKEHEESKA